MDAGSERDRREFVQELKFLLTPHAATAVAAWVRHRLDPDPHGGGLCADEYRVTSVYFDTPGLDVYRRIASFGRAKYRVRRYDASDVAFLERKTKTSTRVSKRRSRIAVVALPHLADRRAERGRPDYWFHRRLIGRALQPVCGIGYQRLARIGQTESGPVRATIDQDVQAWRVSALSFEAVEPVPLLRNRPILELKYCGPLPALFKELIREFAPTPQGISKYRFALPALGLASRTVAVDDGCAETVNA